MNNINNNIRDIINILGQEIKNIKLTFTQQENINKELLRRIENFKNNHIFDKETDISEKFNLKINTLENYITTLKTQVNGLEDLIKNQISKVEVQNNNRLIEFEKKLELNSQLHLEKTIADILKNSNTSFNNDIINEIPKTDDVGEITIKKTTPAVKRKYNKKKAEANDDSNNIEL